ncbi:MFS transporter [Thiotrichales bacterium 19S3-7]|nr:MFS transporter [Thiotrichales bacterium 19S3-7]MCF6801559.1 MFS transporter [Thiotrichales bacterium 19S3-11]
MKKNSLYAAGVCFLGGLFVLFQFLLQGSVSLMVSELKTDLCIDQIGIGFLSSSFLYPYIILQIPAGIIVDKLGVRRTLVASTLLLIFATFGFALSYDAPTADLARMMMGIASAPGVVCAMCLAANWFSKKYFPLVAGFIEMLGMFGGALGDILLSISVKDYGWRYTILFCSIFSIILFLLIVFFVKDKPTPHQHDISFQSECSFAKEQSKLYFAAIFKSKDIWLSCLYGGAIFAVITAFASLWSIPFFNHLYNSKASAHITAFIFIGAGFGTIFSGWLSAKLGAIKPVMVIFSILALILFVIILYLPLNTITASVISFLLGLMIGAYVLPFALIKRLVPESSRGVAMGFTNMSVIIIGAIFLPLIGGLLKTLTAVNSQGCVIADTTIYQIAFIPLTVGLLAAVILALFIRENY